MKHRSVRSLVLPIVALAMLGAACSSGDSAGGGDAARSGAARDAGAQEGGGGADAVAYEEALSEGSSAGRVTTAALSAPSIGPNVIKTAELGLEVPKQDFRAAVSSASTIASSLGGFVLSTDVSGSRAGTIVLRVPAENFDDALGELRRLGETKEETISGRDVSEEFVDLQARLRNLEAQETVLLRLMDRAQTVVATIKVQRELSGVQMEIERLRGRIRFLDDQTSFSTITARIARADLAPPEPAGSVGRAWENAQETFMAVVSAIIIGSGFVLPLALLLVLVALVARVVRPRFFQGTP